MAEDRYNHSGIEKKWQKRWADEGVFTAPDVPNTKKCYVLDMFPYPSGEGLHVGHPKGYIATDVYSRMKMMQGYDVLHPMGWDAFGLPAENYAIKNKVHPRVAVEKNIARFKDQLSKIGFTYDWTREINTTDPEYYKWTQWIFLQLYKKGLAYESFEPINWCPSCQTGLANEDLDQGRCERCGSVVEKRPMRQWMLKITDYAEKLLAGLADLPWPESIKEIQRNWIGKSEGAEIDFPLSEDSKMHYVLLHGREGSSKANFFPWLKQELEKRGHTVEVPELPNTNEPHWEEQTDFVQANCTLDENTVIVGHSFGGVVALRLLERGVKVHRVTLAATPFSGVFLDGEDRETVSAAPKKKFDFATIKKNAKGFVVLSDSSDPVVPASDAESLSRGLDCMLIRGKGQNEHFCAEKEPDVLMASAPTVRVFTTRADTLFGCTYLVLSPEHPWVQLAIDEKHDVLENKDEVRAYVVSAAKKQEIDRTAEGKEKTGVELKGVKAIHPAIGKDIPIWVADYVLGHYGTGAVMAVPAHDERDAEFAKRYQLPIKQVVVPYYLLSDDSAPRENVETLERDIVDAVIENVEGKFLLIKEEAGGVEHYHFVGGGTDGEDDVTAIKREVVEETGYTDFEVKHKIHGGIFCFGFRHTKNKNQNTFGPGYYVKLQSNTRIISEVEEGRHTLLWVEKDEVRSKITWPHHQHIWDDFIATDFIFLEEGKLINSERFTGLSSTEAREKITEDFGRKTTTYKLRDWVFSRQRYWGEPIPIVHCEKCGVLPLEEKDLPLLLPDMEEFEPIAEISYAPRQTGIKQPSEGGGTKTLLINNDDKVQTFKVFQVPLDRAKNSDGSLWREVQCPQCGCAALRETNTMPQWAGSSWYYLRFIDPKNSQTFVVSEKEKAWMPVDVYVGGAEHATRHLIYARFWHIVLHELGYVSTPEPFMHLESVGLILAEDGRKMSKRWGNVVNPDDIVATAGADTLRLYEMFMGPFNQAVQWSTASIAGPRRFLERVWRIKDKVQEVDDSSELLSALHQTIKRVTDDTQNFRFNTAIAALMELLNVLEKEKAISKNTFESFLLLLAPYVPHVSEELWEFLGNTGMIVRHMWPVYDAALAQQKTATIVVQVNGKVRGELIVTLDVTQEQVEQLAKELPNVSKYLENLATQKVIYIPGKLISFVVDSGSNPE